MPETLGELVRWLQQEHATERDPSGFGWCEHKGVGKTRADLGDPLGPNVPHIAHPVLTESQMSLLVALREHCARCRGCNLA